MSVLRFIGLLILSTQLMACSEESTTIETEDQRATRDVWASAQQRGVAFRAIGQEPGWLLEITNGEEILLETDYGSNRTSLPYVAPVIFENEFRTQFVLDDYGITVEIRGDRCTDVMSGEQFEFSVTVYEVDRELHGCGRALF